MRIMTSLTKYLLNHPIYRNIEAMGADVRVSESVHLGSSQDQNAKRIVDGLEQAFLNEMLKIAGPKPMGGAFGGGAGEEQFFSIANDITASAMAERLNLKIRV